MLARWPAKKSACRSFFSARAITSPDASNVRGCFRRLLLIALPSSSSTVLDASNEFLYCELPRFEPPRTARTRRLLLTPLLPSTNTKPLRKFTKYANVGAKLGVSAEVVDDQ